MAENQPVVSASKASSGSSVFHCPNGLEVFQHSEAETKYVYEEVFEDRVYLRHGITLAPGSIVFDIGANIGLFTIFVCENYPGSRVFAFEPSPVIYSVLEANVRKYNGRVHAERCGISERPGEATFTFYPHYSIMSGFHAQPDADRQTLRAGIKSRLQEQSADPADIQDRSLDRLAKVALRDKQEYQCRLRSVSDLLLEHGIAAVDLLKIDAEGSEFGILNGIREEHWPRVRQIVAEVHDPRGTSACSVRSLLESRGFSCVFEEERRLSNSGIMNCYARRF